MLSSGGGGIGALTQRLLRRSTVLRLVHIGQIVCIAAILLCLLILAISFIRTFISASSHRSQVEEAFKSQPQSAGAKLADNDSGKFQSIARNNIFGAIGVKAPVQGPTPTPKPAAQSNLSLAGTFIQRGQVPYAIIEETKKKDQDVFNIGDKIFDGPILKAIFSDRVEINRNGSIEVLRLDDMMSSGSGGEGVSSGGDNQFTVDEAEVSKALENLPLLLTQARAVPYFKDGKSIGLRLFAIRNDSLFEKIGLKNGDILKTINGNSLADLTQAIKLFETLKQERQVNLILERNGAEQNFSYSIK